MSNEANAATETVAQAETTPWYGEEYKPLIDAKGWKEPTDALKSYSELEKSFGSRVKIPNEKSTPEERQKFYQQLGCPEKPDGYEIRVPETIAGLRDEGIENTLKQTAHKAGIPKAAFEQIANAYYENVAQQLEKGRTDGEATLKQEFGDKYTEQVTIAQRFSEGCSQEFRDLMDNTGLGNNPIIIKEFINLGRKTLSDTLIKGQQESGEKTDYVPRYKDSPGMYATGEDEESIKARAYFTARGNKY